MGGFRFSSFMKKSNHIIVIGGGIIGAFSAYYLLDRGWAVTIVEKDEFGIGASSGNCGLIVPNHIFPLNSLENLIKAFSWMFKKDSPLYVRPRIDPGLIRWFFQFIKKIGSKSVLKAAEGRHALLKSSWGLYQELIASENIHCDWEVAGSLHAYQSPKAWNSYRRTDKMLKGYGIKAAALDRKEVMALEPLLGEQVCGGWHYDQTAHLQPERLLSELKRILIQRGAHILEHHQVISIRVQSGSATSIITNQTDISGDAFVLAAGAWSPNFSKMLGCDLAIQPGKGYSITIPKPLNFPRIPCFFEEQRVVTTPWSDTCRLGGTMEFSGFDDRLSTHRLSALRQSVMSYSPKCRITQQGEEWCGFRPMTTDGLPYIDYSPRLGNVMIAAGHNMIGLSVAPGSGKLVAEMIDNSSPHINPNAYRLDR